MRSTSQTLLLSLIAILVGGLAADCAPTARAEGPHYAHLKPIESLVGQWEMKGKWADGMEFIGEEQTFWLLDKNFMQSRGWFKNREGKRVEYHIVTGWDPQTQKLVEHHSDSEGGHGKRVGTFDKDQRIWNCEQTGVDGKGRDFSYDVDMHFVDKDTVLWKGRNFKGADEAPDLDITFSRIKIASPEAIPGKALAAMRYFVGKWEGEVFENGEKIGSGESARRWLPGRHAISMVKTDKERNADIHSSGIAGWDARGKQLVEQWHTSTGLSATVRYPLSGMTQKAWEGNFIVIFPDGQAYDGKCVLEKTDTGFEWTATWTKDGKPMVRKGVARRVYEGALRESIQGDSLDVDLGTNVAPKLRKGAISNGDGPSYRLIKQPDQGSTGDWRQYNYDNRGWRFNTGETTLSSDNIARLEVKWRFPPEGSDLEIGPVHTTPVVVDGCVYFGTARPGVVYKLSPAGELVWRRAMPTSGVKASTSSSAELGLLGWSCTNSPLVVDGHAYVCTGDGLILSLDAQDGRIVWQVNTRKAPFRGHHAVNSIWSSPILADGKLIVAGGAFEQAAAFLDPKYPCCSGRGFVVALEPDTGELIWKYNVGRQPQKLDPPIEVDLGNSGKFKYAYGPSTSTVWSTPSFDADSGLLFFGTDTNNSPRRPTPNDARSHTDYSCALIAIDVQRGVERWVRPLVENDVWYGGQPQWDPKTGQYKDVSVGDTPKVYEILVKGRSRSVVGVGCKNGSYYVVDRLTGELIYKTPTYMGVPEPGVVATRDSRILAMPSALGGLQTGCAFDGRQVYVNGIDWLGMVKSSVAGQSVFVHPPDAGRVTALRPDTLGEFWRHERPRVNVPRQDVPGQTQPSGDPVGSGIAVARDVAFFTTTVSGKLVGVSTRTGETLFEHAVGPVWSGPSISRGHVYVGTGSIIFDPVEDPKTELYRFNYPIKRTGEVYCFGLSN